MDVNRNGVIDTGPAFADVGHAAPFRLLPRPGQPQRNGQRVSGVWSHSERRWRDPDKQQRLRYLVSLFEFRQHECTYDNNAADGGPGPPATTGILYAPAPYRPRIGKQWQASHPLYTSATMVDPVNTANGYVYLCTAVHGTLGVRLRLGSKIRSVCQDPIGSTNRTDGERGLAGASSRSACRPSRSP